VVLHAIRTIKTRLFGHGGVANPREPSVSLWCAPCPDQKSIVFIWSIKHATPHSKQEMQPLSCLGKSIWGVSRVCVLQPKEKTMQMVSEIMTRDVRVVSPQDNLQHAAQMMEQLNVGVLPVCDGERLVGIVSLGDVVTETPGGLRGEDAKDTVEIISSPSRPAGTTAGTTDVAGRTGEVTGAAAAGTNNERIGGTDIPRAGQHGMGVGGASGEVDEKATNDKRTGATGDVRRNFGVGGPDLTKDGLPPA
jgi:CBS domain-containing protein